MHAVKMPRGAVSNLTMFLLIIITALLVAVAMLYVQNQNMARLNAGKTIGEPPAAESASVSGQPETPADDSAPEDIEAAGQEEEAENAPEKSAEAAVSENKDENESEPKEAVDPIKSCVTINTVSGTGSGFVCEKDGELYIMTCAHVVYEEPTLIIKDLEGHSLKVEEVLMAKDRDLALIKIEKPDFKIHPLPYHENVTSLTKLPEVVCYGDSEGVGVIVKCEGKLLGIGPLYIETDTPFVSGNSGGPVLLKDTNLVIAVAASLTRRSEGDKWAKGTRFENETRRFSVRFDNLKTNDLEKTEWGKIEGNDFQALDKFAEECQKKGDYDTYYKIIFYNAGFKDTWALNKCCEILLAELIKKPNKEESEREQYQTFKTFKSAADNNIPGGLFGLGLCYICGIGTNMNTEEGFRKVQEAARAGYAAAQYVEGYCYFYGTGTNQDLEKAFASYKKAAAQNNLKALNALGDCYHYGWGTATNDNLAKECFQKAADKNDAEGQWNMGLCYEYGIAVPVDYEKAVSYYVKSAEQGYVQACVRLADAYMEKKDYKSAVALYRKGADQNDPEAIFALSVFYKLGLGGLPKDTDMEIALIKQAADLENENAMLAMGNFYLEGYYPIVKNPQEAALWYLKAAELGNAAAKKRLGDMYASGEYGDVNLSESFKYYKEAAESGCEEAFAYLGLCYLYGAGTERNMNQAVYWIGKAANAGIPYAQRTFAQCYYNGWGVPMNYQNAFYWYEKSAQGEDPDAMLYTGVMWERGMGVPKADYQKAADWYAKSYMKGNTTAAFNLGLLYFYGSGVAKDYNYAKQLFKYAWEKGQNQDAYKMMLQCP